MNTQRLTLHDIYQFFQTPQPIFLNQELAVCYLMSVLIANQSYGTELVQQLKQSYPNYRLSDTILQNSLRFLENQALVTSYWKKPEKRGRPRRMYQIRPEEWDKAEELAKLWYNYAESNQVGHLTSDISSIA
ncbi:MAG TPA: helix-turn-helix transcriptional regulator [Leptolyngbya sp.]|jgi:DNA-binding PadR family transcriptional regulator|nr:helix-turn-helix transcriptional regulator [Leptolyngbya sp.]